MNLKKSISLVLTLCMVFSLFATFVFPVAAEEGSVTISFADIANRTEYTTEIQVWEQNGVTVTNNKANSTSDVGDYKAPARFYKNSSVTVEYAQMTKIVIDCSGCSDKNTDAWTGSCNDANATATRNGSEITIVFAEAVDTFTIALTANQARAQAMTIYYLEPAAPVTSQVVDNWNVANWNDGLNTSNGAYIFTDAELYTSTDDVYGWWRHVAFAPTDVEGTYEVTAVANGEGGEARPLAIPENGFAWVAFEWAAEGSGAYAHAVMATLKAGDKVVFTGLDIANCTTTADATAEKVVVAPEVEEYNISVSHVNKYSWGEFNSFVVTGEGNNCVSATTYPCEWWIAIKVDNVDGVYTVTAIEAAGEAKVNTCSADGFIVYTFGNDAASYEAAGLVEVGDVLLASDVDLTTDVASETPVGTMTFGPAAEEDSAPSIDFAWVDEWKEVDENGVWQESKEVPADELFDYDYAIEKEGDNVNIGIKYRGSLSGAADSFGNGKGTNFRIWFFNPSSEKGWDTLMDVSYNGSEWVVECRSNGASPYEYPYGTAETPFTVTVVETADGAEVEVVLPISVLGYDSTYFKVLLSASNKEVSNYCLHCDNDKSAPTTTARWENSGVVIGEVPAPEYNEVVVDVKANAMLTDGVTGFTGNWNEGTDASNVLLIGNDKCTEMAMNVVVNYALGETKTIDALVLDFYHCAGVMIGYPEGKVLVEYSVDGVEYTAIGEYDLAAAELVIGSYGTVSSTLAFDAVDAAYVRATFVVGSSTGVLGENPTEGKVFWEFASLAEVAVNEVSNVVELPEDATGLDYFGYTHTYINHVMYVDADMTLGELVAKYYGTAKDLNYFKVIVVNADGTVAATYLTLGRPDGVKTDFTVTAGQYVLALSADGSNTGRFEIADTVNVGDIVTLYNVDFTAEPGELTNAGFTVEAAPVDLNEVNGGALPVFNPFMGTSIPANTAITYTVEFADGAFLALYDPAVTVLVNGEAFEGAADLKYGDKVTIINAAAEDVAVFPRVVPVINGSYNNPIEITASGDYTAVVNDLIIENSNGTVFFVYKSEIFGTLTVTMPSGNWFYNIYNETTGKYGDNHYSDDETVVSSETFLVSPGDVIMVAVATYDPANPWSAPLGELTFNVAISETAKLDDRFGAPEVLFDGYTGVGEITGYEDHMDKLLAFNYLVANGQYTFSVTYEEMVAFDGITLYTLDYANGCVVLPESVVFVVNGVEYEAVITPNANGIATVAVALDAAVVANEITVIVTTDGNAGWFNAFSEFTVNEVAMVSVPDGYGSLDVLFDGYTGVGEITGYEGNQSKLFALMNNFNATSKYTVTVTLAEGTVYDGITFYALDYANGCILMPEAIEVTVDGETYYAYPWTQSEVGGDGFISEIAIDFGKEYSATEITVTITVPYSQYYFSMFTEVELHEIEEAPVTGNVIVPDGWGTVDVLIDGYTGVGEITAHDGNHDKLVPFKNGNPDEDTAYSFIVPLAESTSFNTVTVYALSHTNGHVALPKTLSVTINGKTYEAAVVTGDDASVVAIVVELGETVEADKITVNATIAAGANKYTAYSEVEVSTVTAKAPDVVDLKVSHQNLYNWGTYESMIICAAGKTVNDVIEQKPEWWVMYVVEEIDGVYVATKYFKNSADVYSTACPENGFLYYVYSANSAYAVADEGKLLGYYFNLNDIVLGKKYAIDTSKEDGIPFIMTAVNPDALKVGDVNMNGKIDANDYATIRKLVVRSLNAEDVSAKALELADVNGNGKIDANDYILVKRHVLGTYTIPAWAEVE